MVCVRAACDCIDDMPDLRTEPIIMALLRMLAMLVTIPCLLCVLAARNVPSPWQDALIIYLLSALVWSMEFLSAVSCFAVSFATECWFYADPEGFEGQRAMPTNVLKKGYVW